MKATAVFFIAASVAVFAYQGLIRPWGDGKVALSQVECNQLSKNFQLETVGLLPESVTSMVCDRGGPNSHLLYVGTRGDAGVFRVGPRSPYSMTPMIVNTGEQPMFGAAAVSTLTLRDFDRDGHDDLVALTAQELPRGRSRAYVVSLEKPSQLMSYADIPSSWPHGIAFVRDFLGRPTFLSAYCGHGEIVEFRMFERKTAAGFHAQGLESRKLGTLTASGEQIAGADLFGAGQNVLVSRGFKFNSAAIEIYSRDTKTLGSRAKPGPMGLGWVRTFELREDDRFGNVRFLVGKTHNGVRDLFAWWCAGLADGDTELVHYKLDVNGVVERRSLVLGQAHDVWPEENRMVLMDADGDGRDEVYFSGRAGKVWRWDVAVEESEGAPLDPPTLIASFPGGGGPIAAGPRQIKGIRPLYVGVGSHIVKLTPKPVPTAKLPSETEDPTSTNDF